MEKGNKKLQSSQHNSLQWHLKEVEVQQSAQRITTLHVITFRVQPFAKVVQGVPDRVAFHHGVMLQLNFVEHVHYNWNQFETLTHHHSICAYFKPVSKVVSSKECAFHR